MNMSFNKVFLFCVLLHLILSTNSSNANTSDSKIATNSIGDTIKSMQRAITTSQVLTFNITNALILLGLKGILIGAGILGKISFWKYPNLGGVPVFRDEPGVRSFKTSQSIETIANQIYYSIFSDEDKRWSSAYIWAVNKKDYGCLYRLACENRQSAQIYLYGGRFFNKAVNTVLGYLNLSYDRSFYEHILNGIQRAMNNGQDNCRTRFKCSAPFDKLEPISFLQSLG